MGFCWILGFLTHFPIIFPPFSHKERQRVVRLRIRCDGRSNIQVDLAAVCFLPKMTSTETPQMGDILIVISLLFETSSNFRGTWRVEVPPMHCNFDRKKNDHGILSYISRRKTHILRNLQVSTGTAFFDGSESGSKTCHRVDLGRGVCGV